MSDTQLAALRSGRTALADLKPELKHLRQPIAADKPPAWPDILDQLACAAAQYSPAGDAVVLTRFHRTYRFDDTQVAA
jgi:hypothetical protein